MLLSLWYVRLHYDDVTMSAIASQITSLAIVYSIVYSDADQSKHQSSASLAFVWGIHRGPVNSPHKWPVTRKMFPFDDVIMWMEFVDGKICKSLTSPERDVTLKRTKYVVRVEGQIVALEGLYTYIDMRVIGCDPHHQQTVTNLPPSTPRKFANYWQRQ